jgi:hypothetical protein
LRTPKKTDPEPEQLRIKIGDWLEASATGRFAIAAVVFAICAKALGFW